MSSKILSGDLARSASAIQWSRQAPIYADQPRQPSSQHEPALPGRSTGHDPDMQAQIAQARSAGRAEAEQALHSQFASEVEAMNVRVARTLESLAAFKPALRRQAEQDVVKLAIAIARKILHREIAMDADALGGLVKVALEKIEAREVHRVRVHPEQVAPIERALHAVGAPKQIEIQADSGLERGAAIFETARGFVDVSVETQLKQIESGFADLVARK